MRKRSMHSVSSDGKLSLAPWLRPPHHRKEHSGFSRRLELKNGPRSVRRRQLRNSREPEPKNNEPSVPRRQLWSSPRLEPNDASAPLKQGWNSRVLKTAVPPNRGISPSRLLPANRAASSSRLRLPSRKRNSALNSGVEIATEKENRVDRDKFSQRFSILRSECNGFCGEEAFTAEPLSYSTVSC